VTNEELLQKYSKFCGYMAWQLVRKSDTLGTEDAEDIASYAVIRLIQCPEEHRHEPAYVKRLIINRVITHWQKMCKQRGIEIDAGSITISDNEEIPAIEQVPDPTNIEHLTIRRADQNKMLLLLGKLPDTERIVIELNFGLNGSSACGVDRIARRVGRTPYWVQARLNRGIRRMREMVQ
jgi:RNA polymerase sigma factor (sigma-70 family)